MSGRDRVTGIFVAVAVAVGVLLLATVPTYYIQSASGGSLMWNANEAYVFEGVVQRGFHFSRLGYLVEFVREIFPFGASSPDDKHFSVAVLRITPEAVQRYVIFDFNSGGRFDALGQSIYSGDLYTGALMKWSGSRFEAARAEDQQKLRNALNSGKIPPGPSYDNVDGWSKRSTAGEVMRDPLTTAYVERDAKVLIELNGNSVTFVMNSGFISREAYIDLLRSGQPSERIWYWDGRTHKVSKTEYKRIFTRR